MNLGIQRVTHTAAGASKSLRWLTRIVLATGVLLLPLLAAEVPVLGAGAAVVAAGPGGSGGSGGGGAGGGNAGSGKGGAAGNGGSKPDKGDLYGDMIYVRRDAHGVPIPDTTGCLQPIVWDSLLEEWIDLPLYHEIGFDPTLQDVEDGLASVPDLCLAGEDTAVQGWGVDNGDKIRLKERDCDYDCDQDRAMDRLRQLLQIHLSQTGHYGLGGFGPNPTLDAEDETELGTCDIVTLCADNSQEADLGRLSVLRAPERVIDKAVSEIIKSMLQSSGDPVTLDPSGRLVIDGSALDSPLVNLAMYREMHRWWQLQDNSVPPVPFFTPGNAAGLFGGNGLGDPYEPVIAAAFGLAAGSDKLGSGVDVEVVVRSNAILHLPDSALVADKPGDPGFPNTIEFTYGPAGEEPTTLYFIDYSGFSYDRLATYPGCIMYDDVVNWIPDVRATLMDVVFDDEDPGVVTNIAGFALAADDARRVLAFVHGLGEAAVAGRVDPVFTNSGQYCPP